MGKMTRIADVLGEDSWCKKNLSLWSMWNHVAGVTLIKDTFAYKYENCTLFVGVRHQYLITELPYLEKDLVERAKKFYPDIKGLKLVYLPALPEPINKVAYVESSNIQRREPHALELKFAHNLSKNIHSSKLRHQFHKAMKSYLTLYELDL